MQSGKKDQQSSLETTAFEMTILIVANNLVKYRCIGKSSSKLNNAVVCITFFIIPEDRNCIIYNIDLTYKEGRFQFGRNSQWCHMR